MEGKKPDMVQDAEWRSLDPPVRIVRRSRIELANSIFEKILTYSFLLKFAYALYLLCTARLLDVVEFIYISYSIRFAVMFFYFYAIFTCMTIAEQRKPRAKVSEVTPKTIIKKAASRFLIGK